jgi:neutral ceramidase
MRKIIFVTAVMLFSLASVGSLAAQSGRLRAGAARVDITPPALTGQFAGLNRGGNNEVFEIIHDPIYARALVMDSGSGPVAIVALDLVGVGDMMPLRQRIQRELGIAVDHIMITPSHDHSAPRLAGDSPASNAYVQFANEKIVEALKRARESMQPARMGIGAGAADVNVNRDLYRPQPKGWSQGYNPAGRSDKTVQVVKFETLTGEPIAVLFNYAVHSLVTFNTAVISGDLAGAAERLVEQEYDNKVVALFTLGAAADQNSKFRGPGLSTADGKPPKDIAVRRARAFQAMDAQGFMLGSEVLRVMSQIQASTTAPRIAAAESVFTCPVKPDKARGEFKDGVPIRLAVFLVDQIAFAAVSGEVVTNIGARLKAASPLANTILLTYTNERSGYLVDDATYDSPNFEVNATAPARGCAENGIVNGLVGMIKQLY